jgi:hypothetical protein
LAIGKEAVNLAEGRKRDGHHGGKVGTERLQGWKGRKGIKQTATTTPTTSTMSVVKRTVNDSLTHNSQYGTIKDTPLR